MQQLVVGQRAARPEPHRLLADGLPRRVQVDRAADVPDVERGLLRPEPGDGVVDAAEQVVRRADLVRTGDPGRHGVGVVEAGLVLLEGRDHRQDRLATLQSVRAAGAERAAVPEALDGERDGLADVARPQEVPVQGVRQPVGRDRAPGGEQRLREHLTAEHPSARLRQAAPAEQVGGGGVVLEPEDVEHGGGRVGLGRHGPQRLTTTGSPEGSAARDVGRRAQSSNVLSIENAARSR